MKILTVSTLCSSFDLMTIPPLSLALLFSLTAHLIVALVAPNLVLHAAVGADNVTVLVGMLCVGLVKDTCKRVESLNLFFLIH